MRMDKSMSKISTKLLCLFPLSNKIGRDIDDEKFEFLPCAQFLLDFQSKFLKDFLGLQIALNRSIFEVEKCFFSSNKSEFCQKFIGNDISEVCRQKCI